MSPLPGRCAHPDYQMSFCPLSRSHLALEVMISELSIGEEAYLLKVESLPRLRSKGVINMSRKRYVWCMLFLALAGLGIRPCFGEKLPPQGSQLISKVSFLIHPVCWDLVL